MPPQDVLLREWPSRYYQAKPLITINTGQIIFKKLKKKKKAKHFLKALKNNQMQADTKGSLYLEEANEGFLLYTLYLLT